MANLKELLLQAYPRLYHMASGGSAALIKKHGLLSTQRLCDLFDVDEDLRTSLIEHHRPASVTIENPAIGIATIRDQKPMSINGLQRALREITPKDWLTLLNQKVFFWPTQDRLRRMMSAKPYVDIMHDLIIIDTRSLLDKHINEVWLSPLNSGCTTPYAHPRGRETFSKVADYPLLDRRKRYGANGMVAEVAVQDGVEDIRDHIIEVIQLKGADIDDLIQANRL